MIDLSVLSDIEIAMYRAKNSTRLLADLAIYAATADVIVHKTMLIYTYTMPDGSELKAWFLNGEKGHDLRDMEFIVNGSGSSLDGYTFDDGTEFEEYSLCSIRHPINR